MNPFSKTQNFLDEVLKSSVHMGELLVPARSLQTVLGNYCQHLYVWTHVEEYKVRLVGTAIPIQYKNRFLLLCSRHQLKDVNPQDVCLMYPDGSLTVTSGGFRVYEKENTVENGDEFDIAVFDFTEPIKEHPKLKSVFYKFEGAPPDGPSNHILALIVAGYPSADQIYELYENNHIGSVKRNLLAIPESQPPDNCLLKAKFVEPIDFNPDGLSGSPVFVIQLSPSRAQQNVYLAGMVLRCGREEFYFIKSGYIKSFLDSVELRPNEF